MSLMLNLEVGNATTCMSILRKLHVSIAKFTCLYCPIRMSVMPNLHVGNTQFTWQHCPIYMLAMPNLPVLLNYRSVLRNLHVDFLCVLC